MSSWQERYDHGTARDDEQSRAWARRYVEQPWGTFLAKQLAWGCLGALLGLALGSWTLVVVNAVVFAGVGVVGRLYLQGRYGSD